MIDYPNTRSSVRVMPCAPVLCALLICCALPKIAARDGVTSMAANNIKVVAGWLRSQATLHNGAILYSPTNVKPRYANIAALGLLQDQGSQKHVQNWMTWYLTHLNWPDQWGVYGTIYDFYLTSEGKLKNSGATMTVASNAATFMSLMWAAWQRGDEVYRQFVREAGGMGPGQIFDILGAIVVANTVDAPPAIRQRYDAGPFTLAAACDVYRGLLDLSSLFLHAFNNTPKAEYYFGRAQSMAEFVEAELFVNDMYLPFVGANTTDPSVWHPDAVSILYPIVYDAISPSSKRAVKLWKAFRTSWPGWSQFSYSEQDPMSWEIVSFASAIMDDQLHAMQRLHNTFDRHVSKQFPWPWTCEDAGWFLQANGLMRSRYSL